MKERYIFFQTINPKTHFYLTQIKNNFFIKLLTSVNVIIIASQ